MGWTVVVIWIELFDSAFSVPRVGHGYYWYKTKEECETHLLDSMRHIDDLKATTEPEGIVIEFPYFRGKGYKRCVDMALPDWG